MRIFLEKKAVKLLQRSKVPPPNPCWPPTAEYSAHRPTRCYSHLLI